jgi:photosystem II stability/assembly factor-like uncharacterized protein
MKYLIPLLFATLLTSASSAQWTRTNGPESGAGYGIFEPQTGKKLFACTFDGVYVSTDNALSWQPSGLQGKAIYQYAAGAVTMYVSVDDTLYRSNDGQTWEQLKVFGGVRITDILAKTAYLLVSVYDENPDIGGLYRTLDDGETWQKVTTTSTFSNIRSLCSASPYILAATRNDGIYQTTNAGTTWNKASNGLTDNPEIYTMLAYGGPLYIAGTNCFFYSTNSGDSWITPKNTGLDSTYGFQFYTLNRSLTRIIASMTGPFNDIMYSDDNGENWYVRDPGQQLPASVSPYAISSIKENCYIQIDNGIFHTSDKGVTWTERNNGIPTLFSDVGFSDGNTLVSWGQAGLFKTDNSGVNWLHITDADHSWIKVRGAINFNGNNYFYGDSYWGYGSSGITNLGQGAVDVVHFGNGLVRLTNLNSLQYSTNGTLWDSSTFTPPDELLSKAYTLASSGTSLILQCFSQNYDSLQWYRSTDGNNWVKVYEGDFSLFSFGSVVHKGVFYIGTQSNGLKRSDDDGVTWKNDEGIDEYASIDALYSSGSHLFCDVGYDNNIAVNGINMRKENSGSFTFAGQGLPYSASSLYLHNDGYLYAGSTGVWKRPLAELGINDDAATEPTHILRPNPATDYIIVDEDATVTLFTSTGAEVFTTKAIRDERITLPKLASGVYIAKIETKTGVKSAKVVVQ